MATYYLDNQTPVYRNTDQTKSITLDNTNNQLIISDTNIPKTIIIDSQQFSNGTQTLPYSQMYETINACASTVYPNTANTLKVNNIVQIQDAISSGTITATNGNLYIDSSTGDVQYKTKNTTTNATYYLDFSDSSATGVGAIQKTSGITCNPSTNTISCTTLSATNCNASSVNTTSDNSATTCYIPFINTTAGTNKTLYVDDVSGPLSYTPSTSALSCTNYNGPSATAGVAFANNTSTGVISIGVNASGSTTHNILSSGSYTGTTNMFGGSVSSFLYVRGNIRTQYGIRTGTSSYTFQADNLGYTVTQSTTGWTTALSANTQTNITSVSFTSATYGTYLFNANLQISPSDNGTSRQQILGISTTSANYGSYCDLKYTTASVGFPMLKVTRVLNIYADTTVYLVGYNATTTATVQPNGIFTYTRIA